MSGNPRPLPGVGRAQLTAGAARRRPSRCRLNAVRVPLARKLLPAASCSSLLDGDRIGVNLAQGTHEILHHVGIYAFRRERLLAFPGLSHTDGERRERLEQLRALEHGWSIRILDASRPAFGIDTRADYDRFLAVLAARGGAG